MELKVREPARASDPFDEVTPAVQAYWDQLDFKGASNDSGKCFDRGGERFSEDPVPVRQQGEVLCTSCFLIVPAHLARGGECLTCRGEDDRQVAGHYARSEKYDYAGPVQ